MTAYGGADNAFGQRDFAVNNNFFVNKSSRKRLNIVAILIALFAPWGLFCIVMAVLCFSTHFYQPLIAYTLATICFLGGVCYTLAMASKAMERKITEAQNYHHSWYIFLFITSLLAFVIGSYAGEENYGNEMYKYYSLTHLAQYRDVDTSSYLGQQLMDAGRIDFQKGTRLDILKSMGFKNHDLYCVAPIVTPQDPNATTKKFSYDFWAVGKNCCSGNAADFHCTGFADRKASGGIRLMTDEDRPFYRMAVQQAEAMYQITATHPLFLEWVHDGDEAISSYAQRGYTYYFLSICTYFVFQSFLVLCTTLIFAKLMHYPSAYPSSGSSLPLNEHH